MINLTELLQRLLQQSTVLAAGFVGLGMTLVASTQGASTFVTAPGVWISGLLTIAGLVDVAVKYRRRAAVKYRRR